MKSSWTIWIVILGALVAILLYLNISSTNYEVSLKSLSLQDEDDLASNLEYVFMESETAPLSAAKPVVTPVPQAARTAAPVSVKPAIVQGAAVPAVAAAKVNATKNMFAIQVGSFKDKLYCDAELKKTLAAGFPAYMVTADLGEKGVRYRIYVGKFTSRTQADQLLPKVKAVYKDSFLLILK